MAKIPHSVVCSFFFFKSPAPTPLQITFFASFVSVCLLLGCHFLGVVRVLQCSTSPIRGRLLKSSLSCPCHLCLAFLTSKYVSCFTSQCRQSGLTQQNRLCAAVLDGPGSFSSQSAPLHTCTNVFVLHLHMPPPPCPMFRDASLFFSRYPSPNCHFFRVCWWIQSLFQGAPGHAL